MAAATDNADELIKNADPRIMNRARQDSITTEIMEIVGGAEALRPESTTTRVGWSSRPRSDRHAETRQTTEGSTPS